jgi:outer membrane usher protein
MSIWNLCWTNRKYVAAILVWVFSIPCVAAVPVQEFQERLMLVDINRQQLNQTVLVLEDKTGGLYFLSKGLQNWRLRLPDANAAVAYQGEKYFPLNAIPGVSYAYDPKMLTLMIEVRADAFTETVRTSQYTNRPLPVKPGPGGFINYELFAAHSTDSTQKSGQVELGYFNRFGVGTGNVLANNLGGNFNLTRLDSTWTVDYPEKMQTLHLGDTVTMPGTWGRSVRFGGIQFGTNFGTRPDFDIFPPQSTIGQAALPSTVDVFINNALVSRQNVPPGPFSISNLPVVTGEGNVRLEVRDLFGREQVITRPFYASQSLLREGLENFSYEFGFVRENFGINSNDYGEPLGTGTYRRGLSEHFTGELHAEAIRNQATVGIGGDYLIRQLGTISTYVAGSQSKSGKGGLVIVGVDRLAQPWSLGARTQWISSGFTQIGLQAPQLPPVQLSSLNLSYATLGNGSVGIAYVTQNNRNQPDSRIATLSYSVSLGKNGSFTLSVLRTMMDDVSTSIFALFSISLDASTSLSGSLQSMRGGNAAGSNDFSTILQRSLPLGEGYGYQLQTRTDGYREASYSLQNNVGTYTIDAAQSQSDTATRLDISGGLALLGNNMFLSRRIDQSFAVASIQDYPNVRVLVDNQPAGRTDGSGNALIPRLRAYDINVISIDQRDLPLDAEISTLKLEAVPYFRSGIEMKFPIRHSHGATFTIHLEDGKPLPVGASVQEIGKDEIYTVGYDGEVYIAGLDPITRLRATWDSQSCEFDVRFTASADSLPDLGTFICQGVTP